MIALLLASTVKADQPVHCLLENVKGTWDFTVHNEMQTVNLLETKQVCTHNVPNGFQVITPDYKFTFGDDKQTTKYRFKLGEDYKLTGAKCTPEGNCDGQDLTGTYSTVYDQGLRILLDDG